MHKGSYRARSAKRTYIPKADGSQRPLSIWCLEDKIVQQAVGQVLAAIYEEDFVGFSYGFRPGRSQHDALDALNAGIYRRRVNWVLDADIQGFFDAMSHDWIIRFLKHRIADRRILRLIVKWLKVGTVEDGCVTRCNRGAPQGAVISPILANVYLHYAYDLWVHRWRTRTATGDVVVIRYADDTVVGFQHEHEARVFLEELKERLRLFDLTLHPAKTRLIRFGRFAAGQRSQRGDGKPETFDFLGFTHFCTRSRNGKWLNRVLPGHLNYYAVPGNGQSLGWFFHQVRWQWLRTLRRRSQRSRMDWQRFARIAKRFIPPARIKHPLPGDRFDARTQGRSPVR